MRRCPTCETLEGRQLLASGLSISFSPAVEQLAQEPTFAADRQSQADVHRFESDVLALAAKVQKLEQHFKPQLLREALQVYIATRHMPTADQAVAAISSTQFSMANVDVARDQAPALAEEHAALATAGVPARLNDAFVSTQRRMWEAVNDLATGAGKTLIHDYSTIMGDGLRTGAIKPGDPLYEKLSAAVTTIRSYLDASVGNSVKTSGQRP